MTSISLDLHHHFESDEQKVQLLEQMLHQISQQLEQIMATIDDLVKDVSDESTLIDGVSTLLAGIEKQLADALAGATLSPAVQAQVDAVFATAEANKAKLTAALASGTPVAAVPPAVLPAVPATP